MTETDPIVEVRVPLPEERCIFEDPEKARAFGHYWEGGAVPTWADSLAAERIDYLTDFCPRLLSKLAVALAEEVGAPGTSVRITEDAVCFRLSLLERASKMSFKR